MNDQVKAVPEKAGTILLVDDEANILSSLKRLFHPLNYNILTAGGGVQGLEILAREPVDLVISDMRMPEMDGATFLKQVAITWPETTRILLTGYSDIDSTINAINEGHVFKYISKPWEERDLKLTIKHVFELQALEKERHRLDLLTQRQNEELNELNEGLEKKVLERTAELEQMLDMLDCAHEDLKKGFVASVKVFSDMIEMREEALSGHSRRVADLSYRLAIALGMHELEAKDLILAGLLHDIGKVGFSDNLLNRSYDSLGAAELVEVQKLPIIGESLLVSLEPLHQASKIIRHQHERYDGQGYPDALVGDDIPLGARIIKVVNDFDELQTGTLVREQLSKNDAGVYLTKKQTVHYDPVIVDALIDMLKLKRHEDAKHEEATSDA